MFDALARIKQIGTADQIIKFANADLCHQFTHFLGNEEEKVDDMLRLAGKAFAQYRVLCGDTDRAGIEMTLAHHDAALNHQRRGGKSELIGAQQRADEHIANSFHLAIRLDTNATTKTIQHQRLLRLGEAELPRRAGMLDR